jgi:tetratricopeptide (TPR) repeat protein
LALNPVSARALTARGYIKSMYEYDITGALEDFEKAIELDPNYPTAHQWYGELLAVVLRLDEALEQVRIAKELDPLATVIHHVEGWLLHHAGRYEEALESYNNVHKIDPYKAHTYGNLTMLYSMTGDYDLARQSSIKFGEMLDFDTSPTLAMIDALENPELNDRAIKLIQDSPVYEDGVSANCELYMLMGERELTLTCLENAFEVGDPYAIHLNRFGVYDPIREHPRVQALLRKMNLLP